MSWIDWLATGANVAQVGTGIVAVWIGGRYLWRGHRRRQAMEDYLRQEKLADTGNINETAFGRRTPMHLMGNLALTEAEVFEVAFNSPNIKASLGTDKRGRADTLYFEYVEPRGKPLP
jgi:hypothetical protein